MNKCTSIAGHFDGHADALEQCAQHCLVLHVLGYTRHLWTLPLGKNLLCIAPAAARVAGCRQNMMVEKYTIFAGRYDGHGNPLVP
jgi:hypothetical protein